MKKTNRLFLLFFTAIFSISSTVNAQQGSATASFAAYEQSYHQELMDHYSSEVRAKMNQIIANHRSDPTAENKLDLVANDISSLNDNERYVAMKLLISDYEFNLKNNPGTYAFGTGLVIMGSSAFASIIHITLRKNTFAPKGLGKNTVSTKMLSKNALRSNWIWEDNLETGLVWRIGNVGYAILMLACIVGLGNVIVRDANDKDFAGFSAVDTVKLLKAQSADLLSDLVRAKYYPNLK